MAIPGAETPCSLYANLSTLHQRLAGRESSASLAWHQQRVVELTTLVEQTQFQDLLVDTIGRSAFDIAGEILALPRLIVQLFWPCAETMFSVLTYIVGHSIIGSVVLSF